MDHRNLDQVRSLADVTPGMHPEVLSHRERSERWNELLARDPNRRLNTLGEIEYTSPAKRPHMWADNSPLTVAFDDPVLRTAGLRSDRLGDALTFFKISEQDAHHIMCSCLHGQTMSAGGAAARIKGLGSASWIAPAAILAGMFAVPVLLHALSG